MWMRQEMIILDPGSPLLDVPSDVQQVFEGIITSQNCRAQEDTVKQLTMIHDRVKAVSQT